MPSDLIHVVATACPIQIDVNSAERGFGVYINNEVEMKH